MRSPSLALRVKPAAKNANPTFANSTGGEPASPVETVNAVPRPTRSEKLRLQIADEIVRGLLPPGMALDESEIARRFGVSRTPVREAIRELAAAGLVQMRAHRTALVARLSTAKLRQMFDVM